ncbi:UNVERIFIED_CONTAM: Retrovirus-related Pol polyprotein from transposon TNT 1-94 [Sesamum radiatum]|uniref:Retrovirus-related Pol polyprotein from transposon TNT 1-94 n=1 Tax=Sesamum radiatum TaxID=300843 RepID=A0AAW2J9L4_SESRA
MEAEHVACTSAVQEAIWLRRFLKSLRISAHVDDDVVIYCDNTTTIAYAKDPKYHGRTKHIDIRYHFIRDSIAQGEVVLRHIPTNDMIADPFTKLLRRDAFHRHFLVPFGTLDHVMRRKLDDATLACYPMTMSDAVCRSISRKAVKAKLIDVRGQGRTELLKHLCSIVHSSGD